MKLLLATLCEHAELRPDGKVDIRGAFHDLAAPGFPARQDEMELAVVVEWDPDDEGRYHFRLELRGDGPEKPSFTVEGHTDVTRRGPDGRPARTYLMMPLERIIFPRPGPYRMTVRLKGQSLEGPTLHLWEVPDDAPGDAPGA